VREALADVGQALEKCRSSPVWALSGESLLGCLDDYFRLRSQLDAIGLALVREVDGQAVAQAQGATGTAAWLRDRHRVSHRTVRQLVSLAGALHRDLQRTEEALSTGEINLEQAQQIAHAIADLPAEHRVEGEAHPLGQTTVFGPRELELLGRHLFEVVAPQQARQRDRDQLELAEARAHSGRQVRLRDAGAGRVRLSGWLGLDDAAVVRAALDPLCKPGGRGDDLRTPGQRRADALVDVCRLALAGGELPDNGGDRPQVVVTVDLDTLRGQIGVATLEDGSPVSAQAARRIACDAGIIPAALGGAGQVLDLGPERRRFTGAARRAVILRDRGCAFPGCDRPARWCQVHHVVHWVDGGRTDQDNAVLLCGHHHRVLHQGEWQVRMSPRDRLPEFTPPSYVDRDRRALRNAYHPRT
jgi:hypothetical protein